MLHKFYILTAPSRTYLKKEPFLPTLETENSPHGIYPELMRPSQCCRPGSTAGVTSLRTNPSKMHQHRGFPFYTSCNEPPNSSSYVSSLPWSLFKNCFLVHLFSFSSWIALFLLFFFGGFFFFFFLFFWVTSSAYGDSQASGWIGAIGQWWNWSCSCWPTPQA